MDHTRNIHTTYIKQHKKQHNKQLLFINLLKTNAMKKYFMLLAAAATVLAVSCNKEKNQPTTDPTPQIEDNTPQPIRFGTNIAEVKAPITKAAIEKAGWDGEELRIYAFGSTSTGAVDLANRLIGSAEAGAEATAPAQSSNPTGARDAITLYETGTTPYYYKVGEVYNFFGYYLAGLTGTMSATYEIPLTITGKEDIMVATTDKIADWMAVTTPNPAPTVSLDKVYSDKSARQHVVPDLMFKHQLSRFRFYAKYAGEGSNTNIAIKSLKLKSFSEGTLTVANADPEKIGFVKSTTQNARVDLSLDGLAYDGSSAATFQGNTTTHPAASDAADYIEIGNSILAIPEGSASAHAKYNMTVEVAQLINPTSTATPLAETDVKSQPIDFEIDFEKIIDATTHNPITNPWAEPGKQYSVYILVYGFEEVEITVSLEEWGEGGSIELNPDAEDRAAVTINATLADNEIAVNGTTTVTVTSATAATTPTETNVMEHVQVSSSNTRVATVSTANNTITVTGVNPGTCNIYVYVPGTTTYQSGFVVLPLTVNVADNRTATTLDGVPSDQAIDTDDGTYQIPSITVKAGDSALDPQPSISYTSSNPSIATVTNTGLVTAISNGGPVTITISYAGNATYKPVQGTFHVTCSNQTNP